MTKELTPRLFIALPLPAPWLAQIGQRPLPEQAGLRPVAVENLHITLRFIGPASVAAVQQALGQVVAPPFHLAAREPGVFQSPRGSLSLWLSIEPAQAVRHLRLLIDRQLDDPTLPSTHIPPDPKPLIPHLTLARYRGNQPDSVIAQFQNSALSLPSQPFNQFALYASTLYPTGPQYQVVDYYSLQ